MERRHLRETHQFSAVPPLQQNKLGKLEDTDLLLGVQSGMTPDFRQFVAVTFGFTQSLANFRVTKPEAFK